MILIIRLDPYWIWRAVLTNMVWGSAGFMIGAVLGSFVKVLADRSLSKSSFRGRSYCLLCKNRLRWYDLFPVFSYIFLKGKCRYCHKKIGVEYLIVEVAMGVLIGYLFYQSSNNFQFLISNLQFVFNVNNLKSLLFILELLLKIFFITVLAILFLTDLKKMFIPDRIILPSILIGIIGMVLITIYKIGLLYYSLFQNPIGQRLLPPYSDYFQRHAFYTAEPLFYGIATGLLIGGFFWFLIWITRGKGMGGGDVKLGAFMGIMLGFPQAIISLILAFFTGAIFSVVLILAGRKHFGQTIPFGPFLVLGSLLVLFWGDKILDWYLKLGR